MIEIQPQLALTTLTSLVINKSDVIQSALFPHKQIRCLPILSGLIVSQIRRRPIRSDFLDVRMRVLPSHRWVVYQRCVFLNSVLWISMYHD